MSRTVKALVLSAVAIAILGGTTAKSRQSVMETACLKAVAKETGENNLAVLSNEFSQANSLVMIGVGAQRAPWRCLVSNDGIVAEVSFSGTDGDALIPGTNYDATGEIPCTMKRGDPMQSCPFGVERQGNGSGIVTVSKTDGRTRAIFFENGKATGYDESQADPGKFRASREGDDTIVHIGHESYQIPDAVIFGG